MADGGTLVSVVVPAYNEEAGLRRLVEVLQVHLQPLGCAYEIIIVDDGSTDATEAELLRIASELPTVRPVLLSRNFGKESAMAAGLEAAAGDCVAFLDADLQHPPDLLREMFARWREGADVVNAVKRRRADESLVYRAFAHGFNRMMTRMIGRDMSGASDFKIIDRQVADVIRACPERHRFFRGLVAWVGFNVAEVEFDVQERLQGESKWSVFGLIRYSVMSVLSFSAWPLRAVGLAGFITSLLGGLLLIQTLYRYVAGTAAIGFTTVIAVQLLLSGMLLTAVGVVAIYLSQMYEEQKGRPLFVVKQSRALRALHPAQRV